MPKLLHLVAHLLLLLPTIPLESIKCEWQSINIISIEKLSEIIIQAHMLCRNEERPDNDERFISILSSVSFIMLKKGDYIRAKAFAEQVGQFQIFLKLVVVAIQEQNNHDWWSISWRFCTISPTQLPSLYDLRHSTTCVRSQIWWLQFNSTRSNFPVWACSGGVQQGAQGGAWLRRIPGDKDGHFWMWALTLETKDWVAWSCVGKLDCWVELHCKNLSRFKRGRCVGLGEKTKDGLFYWQTCSINAYWCKELDNQLKYLSTESRNAARQSAIAWDQGKTYWIEYFLGAKINHFHWG